MKKIPLSQKGKKNSDKFTKVDDADYEWLSKYRWHIDGRYVVRVDWNHGDPIKYFMHREIMKTPDGMFTDYINHNIFNNQKVIFALLPRIKMVQIG
jgi:hypothetical protein